ncbi:MAG TPA: TVP38/TMEM64 family protein [Gemmatimonadaceae bacterium]
MQRHASGAHALPSSRAALVRIGGLALLLVTASLIGYKLGWFDYRHTLEHVARLRKSYSFLGFVIVFVAVFGVGTSLGIPALPFTVAAGALFGTLLGAALSWTGAMLGAASGYWIARTIGHNVVVRWLKRYKRADAAVAGAADFAGMLRLRLIPMLPLGIANFVGGLARVPFAQYMAATAIGTVPSLVIYAYFADSLLEGIGSGRADAMRSMIIASILLILLSLVPKIFGRNSGATASAVSGPEFAGDDATAGPRRAPNSHA